MKKILLTILMLPLITFAQGEGESQLAVGALLIPYDTTTNTDSGVLFYKDEDLVASEHGTVLFVYQNDRAVLEAHDISGDGEFDTFLTLDENEAVIKLEGEGKSAFERPAVTEFDELLANDVQGDGDEDLVGDLDSITIPGSGNGIWFLAFLAVFLVASWWYFRNRKDDE